MTVQGLLETCSQGQEGLTRACLADQRNQRETVVEEQAEGIDAAKTEHSLGAVKNQLPDLEKVDSKLEVYDCQCPICRQEANHPDKELHHQINLFLSCLDEQQRRWYIALESKRIGYGGDRLLSQITGMDEKTIRRGRQELAKEKGSRKHLKK